MNLARNNYHRGDPMDSDTLRTLAEIGQTVVAICCTIVGLHHDYPTPDRGLLPISRKHSGAEFSGLLPVTLTRNTLPLYGLADTTQPQRGELHPLREGEKHGLSAQLACVI